MKALGQIAALVRKDLLLEWRGRARVLAVLLFGTVIVGASLLGAVGALLAIPAGATIQAFASTYVIRHELVDSALLVDPEGVDGSPESEGLQGLEAGGANGGDEARDDGDGDGQNGAADEE